MRQIRALQLEAFYITGIEKKESRSEVSVLIQDQAPSLTWEAQHVATML